MLLQALSLLLLLTVRCVFALECYECNSRYDANCADPFRSFSIAAVDCDQKSRKSIQHIHAKQAALCRKTMQYVEDDVRVIRSCGWLQNEGYYANTTCFNKPGTSDIQVYHCVCEGSLCNSSPPNLAIKSPLIAMWLCILTTLCMF